MATDVISASCSSNFAWNSFWRAKIASEHPQVGVGNAVTLPSMQRAARHLSRKVPFILGYKVVICGAGEARSARQNIMDGGSAGCVRGQKSGLMSLRPTSVVGGLVVWEVQVFGAQPSRRRCYKQVAHRQVWYESTATEGGAFERPKHGTMRRAWLGSVGAGSMRWPGGRARARERSGGGVHGELLRHRVFLGRAGGRCRCRRFCGKPKTCCKGVESPSCDMTSYDTWEEALPIANFCVSKKFRSSRGVTRG